MCIRDRFQNGEEFHRFELDGIPHGSPDSGEPYEKQAGLLIWPNLPTRTLPKPEKPSVPAVYTAVSYTHLDVYKRQVLHRNDGWQETVQLDGVADGVNEDYESGERAPDPNPPSDKRIWNYSWKYLPRVDANNCLLYTSRCV